MTEDTDSDKPARLHAWGGGSLLAVKRNLPVAAARKGGGPRGPVRGFTRAARLRLLRTVAKLRRDTIPLFVTLTYPAEYSHNPDDWKRNLKAWSGRLKRRNPGAAFIWRLELQQRGAPHYHLLLFGVPPDELKSFREWLSTSWYEVVQSADKKHLAAGTNAQRIRTHRGVMSYAGKELAKTTQSLLAERYADGVGKWWGAYHRKDLPIVTPSEIALTQESASRMMRTMRRYANIFTRSGNPSLTIFCDPDWWLDHLPGILGEADDSDQNSGLEKGLARLLQVEQRVRGEIEREAGRQQTSAPLQ